MAGRERKALQPGTCSRRSTRKPAVAVVAAAVSRVWVDARADHDQLRGSQHHVRHHACVRTRGAGWQQQGA